MQKLLQKLSSKNFRSLILYIVLVVSLMGAFYARAYYSPGASINHVSDFGNVLTDEQENSLNEKLKLFTDETTNEIAVVTINSLEGDYIENFGVKLFEEWGIGTKENDNGVLLLISRDDREMRIEVGYGLEGALTDAQSASIRLNQITPPFKEGNYYEGINAGVDAMISATRGEYIAEEEPASEEMSQIFVFLFFIFFMFFNAFLHMFAKTKSWWLGGLIGGVAGGLIILFIGFATGVIWLLILTIIGFLVDYILSRIGPGPFKGRGIGRGPFMSSGGSGGGFSGFSGGRSGGGGSSGGW